MKRLIEHGRVIDPASSMDDFLDILIEDGRIAAMAAPGAFETLKLDAQVSTISAQGCIVCPGLVDMHVHLREPGEEYKETIATGTKAAAAGGFTAVACMANTRPVNDNQSVTEYILEKARREAVAAVYPVAAMTVGQKGTQLTEMGELSRLGVKAVSDDGHPVEDALIMRRAMEYAGRFGLTVISHCETTSLSKTGTMHEGWVSTKLGLEGIPAAAEEIMIAREASLAELTGVPIHIAHVSTAGSVEIIRRAKEKGIPITAETAPHYFSLTHRAVMGYNTLAKMNPPLRTSADVAAIKQGLHDNVIDAIATDHAPHSILEKDLEFNAAANGIIGLETALSLTLTLVQTGVLDLSQALAKLTCHPADILKIPAGRLVVGGSADITIFQPDQPVVVDIQKFASKSRNSPFDGWKLQGKVIMTVFRGQTTYSA
ncbi:MAG: dihydroorotase [Deltaproteobacteria bacterium]|nr:dihydroorotase [Deltaproteobacteria bacterium]